MQQQVLSTALTLVRQLGWTRNALQTAAAQLGLSPAIAGSFPRGAVHLVEAFNTRCNDRLREILVERKEEIDEMDTEDKLAFGVKLRLDMVTDYVESWPDALALQAHPSEVAYSLQNYGTIADILWRGDESTDFSYYTKRAAMSGIYVAAELYLLTDKSEDYTDTWKFVENRIRDMGTMLKVD
jgi:ubiquinone biosynthesis protein COQ9